MAEFEDIEDWAGIQKKVEESPVEAAEEEPEQSEKKKGKFPLAAGFGGLVLLLGLFAAGFVVWGSNDSGTAQGNSGATSETADDEDSQDGDSPEANNGSVDWPGDPEVPDGSARRRTIDVGLDGNSTLTGSVPSKAVENSIIDTFSERFPDQTLTSEATWHPDASDDLGQGVISINEVVNFDSGQSTISNEADTSGMDLAVSVLNNNPTVFVVIVGHTDDGGDAAANADLANERASAVAGYLIEQGVIETQIVLAAAGEDNPIATNSTEEGRELNRRVEVKFENLLGQ